MEAITTAKRILACDDDPDILSMIEVILNEAGFNVDTASSSDEFFEKYTALTPDLILLDVRMPDHDGFWMAQELQRLNNRAAIIFITAHNRSIYRLCEPDSGAVDFVVKPFDPEVLIARVKRAVNIISDSSNESLYVMCGQPCVEQSTE